MLETKPQAGAGPGGVSVSAPEPAYITGSHIIHVTPLSSSVSRSGLRGIIPGLVLMGLMGIREQVRRGLRRGVTMMGGI